MKWIASAVASVAILFSATAGAAEEGDVVLRKGEIISFDDRFTIAQALAIKGQRIIAVGTTADIRKLATPATRLIELNGHSVIPGLIDNHSHWIRAAEHRELRFDGVTSRK